MLPMVSSVFETRHCKYHGQVPGALAWGKDDEGRSSQGHTEKGTQPCSPARGESQPKWSSF